MKYLAIILASISLISSCVKEEGPEPDIMVRAGENFIVELEANWSTGYSWQWTNRNETTLVDTIDREYIPADTTLGSRGLETWTFMALTPGDALLKFSYMEPGSAGYLPSGIMDLVVRIY